MHVCLCACVSVAVFMACQDVEVAVGCRVVCRPALQHHHPANKHTRHGKNTTSGLVSREGKRTFSSHYFAVKSQMKEQPSLLQCVVSFLDWSKHNTEEHEVWRNPEFTIKFYKNPAAHTGFWSKPVKALLFGEKRQQREMTLTLSASQSALCLPWGTLGGSC